MLDILYEDQWLVVVNKPAKSLSVPGRGADKYDSIVTRAEQHYGEAHAIHRLDYATSGLILIARDLECQKRMYAQFRERHVQKEYRALVRGRLLGEFGEVRKPLRCDWDRRPRQMICTEWGKDAITHWRPLGYENGHTRVSLTPITGRSHQLRVHMQSLGHPIIGDDFYDSIKPSDDERLRLHAYRVEFFHPFTQAWVKFVAPCPF